MIRFACSTGRVTLLPLLLIVIATSNRFHLRAAERPNVGSVVTDWSGGYRSDPKKRLLDISLEAKLSTVQIPRISYREDKHDKQVAVYAPTYNGKLVGPTLRVRKGDRLRVLLQNHLDPTLVPSDPKAAADQNLPNGFATTNLHTHGLHASPIRAADNVDLDIKPGQSAQYEFDILPTQQAGTFWYHAHRHGSAAWQMAGGMVGALIVEDDLNEKLGISNDGDQVTPRYRDRILVLQQVHGISDVKESNRWFTDAYSIYDKLTGVAKMNDCPALAATPTPINAPVSQHLDVFQSIRVRRALLAAKTRTKSVNEIPLSMDPPHPDPASKEDQIWLLTNGQSIPTLEMKGGDLERWRFIHSGIDEAIHIAVVDSDNPNCYQSLVEIAIDGVTRDKSRITNKRILYPGYRWDILFQAPENQGPKPKLYYLIDDRILTGQTLSGFDKTQQGIAIIKVNPTKAPTDRKDFAKDPYANLLPFVADEFKVDISDAEVQRPGWTVEFDFPDTTPARLLINHQKYARDRIDHRVRLNQAEEWSLKSSASSNSGAGHICHIHTNSFQHVVYETSLRLKFNTDSPTQSVTDHLKRLGFENDARIEVSINGDAVPLTIDDQTTVQNLIDWLSKLLSTQCLRGRYQVGFDEDTKQIRIRDSLGAMDQLKIAIVDPKMRLSFVEDRRIVDRVWRDTLLVPSGKTEQIRLRFRDWVGKSKVESHLPDYFDQGMIQNILIECDSNLKKSRWSDSN